MSAPDLSRPRRVHVVGIGGAGMSAIATVLREMGHVVSGSDVKDGPALERLRALGVEVRVGHDAANVAGAEVVATSSAVPPGNVELAAARSAGVPIHSRAETLAAICAQRRTLAVAGTHGKTTTTSMVALVAAEAGLSPSFLVGGEVNEIGTNAAWCPGEWLVVEADESDGTFLELAPEVALVTNVEPDHLEHYGSVEALERAFGRFLANAPRAVVCADDARARSLAPPTARTYGFAPGAHVRIARFAGGRASLTLGLEVDGEAVDDWTVPVPGAHNARNVAGAAAAALELGIRLEVVGRALARFAGVARRFEFRGERNGVTFVDDYAHLPGEVEAALSTARLGGFRRIVAVFQPHRYSRVEALAPDFAHAFVQADVLVVTPIYAAGESARPGVSSKLIVDAVLAAHPEARVVSCSSRGEVVEFLAATLRPGDCCLTLSAGDLTSLGDELSAGGAG
ncbi:MAG TPA: UDP-N-acetylmuramate--L-alanine ligase [Acidimicrobiales bacterium]|nr:UDP-N-acetylmuramate--L-alanine ligase [Acidimicrobiales bacterium]